TILLLVEQIGGAGYHEGYLYCSYCRLNQENMEAEIIGERIFDPAEVYGKKNH
ncbi:MAG: phosphoribosyl-AMP cyclohydrolase, partial [Lentisphaerae bacterium]